MIRIILFTFVFFDIQDIVLVDSRLINQENCINNTPFTSKCRFQINIQNVTKNPLACLLNFTNPNNSILLNVYQEFLVKSQIGTKCPDFKLILQTPIKDEKIEMTCGGTVPVIEKVISNVNLVRFLYDNQNIDNDDTKINITLINKFVDIKSCTDENDTGVLGSRFIWILIAILVGIVAFVFFIVLASLIIGTRTSRKPAVIETADGVDEEEEKLKNKGVDEEKDKLKNKEVTVGKDNANFIGKVDV